ncbi:MAG: beta-lactamase family protein [Clostridia bacterium]|nr:beta-lactamase family protein [Clostridia bacterium]
MTIFSKIEAYMRDELCGKKGIPGCDVIIMQKHRELFRYHCGYSSLEERTPMTGKERYYLYSCTKPLTVAGAMRLVESGKLALDAPVSNYIPAFQNAYLIKDGKAVPPASPITVRHLFTMTAGFDYNLNREPIKKLLSQTEGRIPTVEFAKAALASPLASEPGQQFRYSICHDLLGAVIEAVAEMPFSEYQSRAIFEPLEMEHTGFLTSDKIDKSCSPLYIYNQQSNRVERTDDPYRAALHPAYESGGAGLISTVEDYIRFADAMANEGEGKNGYRLLRPETVKLIRSEQLKNFTINSDFTCAAGTGYGYGLGMRTLVSKADGQRSPLGEFGWDGAACSYVMMDAENGIAIFFATHLLSWPNLLGSAHAPIRDFTYEALGL